MTKTYNGKTIEELGRIAYASHFPSLAVKTHPWDGHDFTDLRKEAWKKSAQAVAEACTSQWISVKERLPISNRKECLCIDENGWMFSGTYEPEFNKWREGLSGDIVKHYAVTHWMPLPLPPSTLSGINISPTDKE